MPRLTKTLPKYRKAKASGRAFVELNGRRFYLGRYGTRASDVEYDRLISAWLQHGRHIEPGGEGRDRPLVELVVAYTHFV